MSRRDYEVLTVVARMYLDAVDADPELEHVSGTQALVLTEIRDAVQRADAYFAKSPPLRPLTPGSARWLWHTLKAGTRARAVDHEPVKCVTGIS